MTRSCMILFLLCFLNDGKVRVVESKIGFGSGEQEWGYVEVRESAYMFWWLYYVNPPVRSQNFSVFSKPLIIWLQGGPGASSTGYGNFEELGPLDINLEKRNHTWVNDYNVLFIDNPVGAGFSYVTSNGSYVKTNVEIGRDLIICIKQFLQENPGFKNVDTYVTSESYGGKMAAEFALQWYHAQNKGEIISNLKGVVLGDAWISPIDSVVSWAPFLLHTAMIDGTGYNEISKFAGITKELVTAGNWSNATNYWGRTEMIILEHTENIDFYNILNKVNPTNTNDICSNSLDNEIDLSDDDRKLDKLMNSHVKKALGLNVTWGDQQSDVFEALSVDFMKPVTYTVEKLLNETNLQIFVLSGQLDLIVATPGTVAWVEKLKWKDAQKWLNSKRQSFSVNNVIEGYIKKYKNFRMYWINRAGHMVPRDNPVATKAVLQDLTAPLLCNYTDADRNININNSNTPSEKPIKKNFRKYKIYHP